MAKINRSHPRQTPITSDYDKRCAVKGCSRLVHGDHEEVCFQCRCKEHRTGQRLERTHDPRLTKPIRL